MKFESTEFLKKIELIQQMISAHGCCVDHQALRNEENPLLHWQDFMEVADVVRARLGGEHTLGDGWGKHSVCYSGLEFSWWNVSGLDEIVVTAVKIVDKARK